MKITEFQKKVYDAVRNIPAGYVSTYALVARGIGCRSARAVGQALRRNPFAPEVPCHRVIRANLTIGGFQGRRDGSFIDKKQALLEKEGVLFKAGRLVDPNRIFPLSGGKQKRVRRLCAGRL